MHWTRSARSPKLTLFGPKKCTVSSKKRQLDKWYLFRAPAAALSKKPNPPIKRGILWAWEFSSRKNQKMPGAHKIGAAISGPRIAVGKLTDIRLFLRKALSPCTGPLPPSIIIPSCFWIERVNKRNSLGGAGGIPRRGGSDSESSFVRAFPFPRSLPKSQRKYPRFVDQRTYARTPKTPKQWKYVKKKVKVGFPGNPESRSKIGKK